MELLAGGNLVRPGRGGLHRGLVIGTATVVSTCLEQCPLLLLFLYRLLRLRLSKGPHALLWLASSRSSLIRLLLLLLLPLDHDVTEPLVVVLRESHDHTLLLDYLRPHLDLKVVHELLKEIVDHG